jgi:hypothetical protein
MDRIENDASKNSSIVAHVFVAPETFLPNRCLEKIGIHIQTHRLFVDVGKLERNGSECCPVADIGYRILETDLFDFFICISCINYLHSIPVSI